MFAVLTFVALFGRPKITETVREQLRRMYGQHHVFDYTEARRIMYNDVDCVNGKMNLVYGGSTIEWRCGGTEIPSSTIVNAEHTVPQSLFDKKPPMVSDLNHLFAAPSKLNNIRSNYPFVEMDYDSCSQFCHENSCSFTKPSNPDDYSCLGKDQKSFMPIKSGRGQVARAVLYFMTMYDEVDMSHVGKLETFKQWNHQFPPTQQEIDRNNAINQTQGNRNPYIDDYTLVDKAFP